MFNKNQMTTKQDNGSSESRFELPPYTPPDWTISELYERSWVIIKKFKVLWVFGMAAAGFGSSFSFDRLSNFDSKRFQEGMDKYFNTTPSPDTPNKISQVLGATSPDFYKNLLSLIPTSFYVLLGLEVLLLVITGIVITLISNSWSTASLIQAIQTALKGEKPTIGDSSEKAFSSIKPLVWLFFTPSLIFVLISIAVFGILAAGIALSGSIIKLVFILLLIITVLFWIYAAIMLTLSQIWSSRKVVLDKAPAFQSLKDGFEISKNKFWPMMLLGLVNTIMSGIVISIPVAVIAGFIFGGVVSFDNSSATGIALLGIGGILLLIFLLGFSLVGGILTAFKASVWTIAYNKIREKYDTK